MANLEPAEFATFREAVRLAEEIAGGLTGRATTAGLDTLAEHGRTQISALPLSELQQLVTLGHVVELEVRSDDWTLYIRWETGGNTIEVTGPIAAAAQGDAADLTRAIERRAVPETLAFLDAHTTNVTLNVRNRPAATRAHWVRTATDLTSLIKDRWFATAHQLTTGAPLLVVDDLQDAVVSATGIVALGPAAQDTQPGTPPSENVTLSDSTFRHSRAGDTPPPSPLTFAGARLTHGTNSEAAADVTAAFNALTFMLAWQLMATTAEPVPTGLNITISGAREVQALLNPATLVASNIETTQADLLDLYRWVAESTEADRVYFAQQALSLALVTANDALTAPRPALRTAKSLYDLSRRGLVTETMAARRSARDNALATGRAAATLARDTVGKATERAVVQVVAIAAIVVARVQDALTTNQAGLLLLLVAALCAGSLAVTHLVTLKSAQDGLDAELTDLDQYRDSLSEDDVRAIKDTGAIKSAQADLDRSRKSVSWTYGLATAAAVIAALVIWCPESEDPAPGTPSPDPTPAERTTPGQVDQAPPAPPSPGDLSSGNPSSDPPATESPPTSPAETDTTSSRQETSSSLVVRYGGETRSGTYRL